MSRGRSINVKPTINGYVVSVDGGQTYACATMEEVSKLLELLLKEPEHPDKNRAGAADGAAPSKDGA